MGERSYQSNDSQMPLMDLAVKYCLKKISYHTSEQEKTPKATKRYEKNEMKQKVRITQEG